MPLWVKPREGNVPCVCNGFVAMKQQGLYVPVCELWNYCVTKGIAGHQPSSFGQLATAQLLLGVMSMQVDCVLWVQ